MGRRNTENEFTSLGTCSSNLMLSILGMLLLVLIPLVMWMGIWPLVAAVTIIGGMRVVAAFAD